MTQERRDFLHLHFIVLIWGFSVILGLLIELPSVEVVFFRTLIASLCLLVLLKIRGRELKLSSIKAALVLLGVGFLLSLHWVLFFLSAKISNASICLAGMATCSLWTSLIEPLFKKERVKAFEVVLSIVAFIGIIVIFKVEFNHLQALSISLVSAFVAAIFMTVNGQLSHKYNPYVISYYEMVGACLSILLFFPIYAAYYTDHIVWMPTISDWGWLIILALVCTVYAYSAAVGLMKRLSVFSINLITNLEPVYGILLALIIFRDKEEMSIGFYFGTSLIIASVLLYPIFHRRHNKKAKAIEL